MRKPLYSWLKRLFSDAHSAIIGIILVSLLAGGTGIYFFLKNLWNELIKIAQFPTPLLATIALVLLSGGYIYLRTRRIHSSSTPKEIMFECRNLKWKIIVKSNSDYKIEFMPYCIIHGKSWSNAMIGIRARMNKKTITAPL